VDLATTVLSDTSGAIRGSIDGFGSGLVLGAAGTVGYRVDTGSLR
jgi:hypothetical protein